MKICRELIEDHFDGWVQFYEEMIDIISNNNIHVRMSAICIFNGFVNNL